MVALGLGSAARAEDLELAVKAAYLYKLAPFVDWPPGALDPQGPFNLCVVGRDPFGSVLDRAVAGQVIGGRPIAVRRLRTIDKGSGCQLAFLAGSPAQSVKDGLHALQGAPVLTVTDGAAAPGIVDLVLSGGRVRFRIDDETARASRLAISSKLLSLAVSVTSKPGLRAGA